MVSESVGLLDFCIRGDIAEMIYLPDVSFENILFQCRFRMCFRYDRIFGRVPIKFMAKDQVVIDRWDQIEAIGVLVVENEFHRYMVTAYFAAR